MDYAQVAVVTIFILSGVANADGRPFAKYFGSDFGYPKWFVSTLGALEVATGLGILVRPFPAYFLGLGIIGASIYLHVELSRLRTLAIIPVVSPVAWWVPSVRRSCPRARVLCCFSPVSVQLLAALALYASKAQGPDLAILLGGLIVGYFVNKGLFSVFRTDARRKD